jgi:predicted GNAT family acetyltransferase
VDVTRNEARHRFEATVDGYTAILAYREVGGRTTLTHTEVPPELRGRGIADALARAALDDARERRLAVRPLCPFVQAFMKRHTEYATLAAPTPPGE